MLRLGYQYKKACRWRWSKAQRKNLVRVGEVVTSSVLGKKEAATKAAGKKYKDEDNVTGGLRLLRRGQVTMSHINQRVIRGEKWTMETNSLGQPIGKAATEMQSYIGVLALMQIPISKYDRREVPLSDKEDIWTTVNLEFVVPPEWKKLVFTSAGNKWREFKSKLVKWYIYPYMENPERTSVRPKLKKRMENKYPHRVGRRGYAGLKELLAEQDPDDAEHNYFMWVKAREDKEGKFDGPLIQN